MIEVLPILVFSFSFLLLFAFAEFLLKFTFLKPQQTRNIVHFLGGLICLFFPIYFKSVWSVVVVTSLFFIVLFLTKQFKILPSVNQIKRNSVGSFLFPVAVLVSYLGSWFIQDVKLYYLSMGIVAVSDPLAAFFGERYGKKILSNSKSILGAIVFFFSAFAISFLILAGQLRLYQLVLIALIATISELYSSNGFDNLTIPLSIICSYTLIVSI